MKETNKSVKKRIFKSFLVLIVSIVIVESLIMLGVYILKGFIFTDEAIIRKNYEAKKEKYELMECVRDNVIKENEGIYLENIPSDDIECNIYTTSEDNNIIFNYYIPHYENQYNTTITLSKEYKILDEKSINKLEDYDTYEKAEKNKHKCQLGCMLVFGAIYPTMFFIFYLLNIKKSKSDN